MNDFYYLVCILIEPKGIENHNAFWAIYDTYIPFNPTAIRANRRGQLLAYKTYRNLKEAEKTQNEINRLYWLQFKKKKPKKLNKFIISGGSFEVETFKTAKDLKKAIKRIEWRYPQKASLHPGKLGTRDEYLHSKKLNR